MTSILIRPTLQNIHRYKKFAYITFTDNCNARTTKMDIKVTRVWASNIIPIWKINVVVDALSHQGTPTPSLPLALLF